ncbi:MAG: 2-dehydropantoate 2-reductase [Pseudomonadota bacterium]|nr:2-dehydropantoate 2-reductase [Pseudomonadota bacterium]
MRILVLGAGGIGGYFGGRLAEVGTEVTFLVRPGRAAQLARDGLVMKSPFGDFERAVRFVTADALDQDGRYDAVLLTCKAYDLEGAIEAIAPAVRHGASVIPLLNGMLHLDRLDRAFGVEAVLGGLCQIAATLSPTGEVHHLNKLATLILGPRAPGQERTAAAFVEAAEPARFDCQASEDIGQDMWEKFILLATMGAMTCLMRANVGEIMQADDGEALMEETLAESDRVAGTAQHPARPEFLARARAILTERGSDFAASMLRDVERGGATEAAHIVGDMVARARSAGLASPMLRVAWCHLQAHEARRQR